MLKKDLTGSALLEMSGYATNRELTASTQSVYLRIHFINPGAPKPLVSKMR